METGLGHQRGNPKRVTGIINKDAVFGHLLSYWRSPFGWTVRDSMGKSNQETKFIVIKGEKMFVFVWMIFWSQSFAQLNPNTATALILYAISSTIALAIIVSSAFGMRKDIYSFWYLEFPGCRQEAMDNAHRQYLGMLIELAKYIFYCIIGLPGIILVLHALNKAVEETYQEE